MVEEDAVEDLQAQVVHQVEVAAAPGTQATHRQLAHPTVAVDTMVEALRPHIGPEDARQVLASRPIFWLRP